MEQTLNEKILEIIGENTRFELSGDGGIDIFDAEPAAKAIEQLVISEKLDLLDEILENIEEYSGYSFHGKKEELQTQLNELK